MYSRRKAESCHPVLDIYPTRESVTLLLTDSTDRKTIAEEKRHPESLMIIFGAGSDPVSSYTAVWCCGGWNSRVLSSATKDTGDETYVQSPLIVTTEAVQGWATCIKHCGVRRRRVEFNEW